jgi:hypothetical protein
MDSSQQLTNVETVEIEEPSDKVQVLSDEKTCITRKHLYIIVGVLLVAAIALIGTLLGFTASQPDGDVNEESLKLGVASTFPLFDANNDGEIDHQEMSNWMSVQLSTCKKNCKGHAGCDSSCGTQTEASATMDANGTVAAPAEVNNMINPCDFNGNGKVSLGELLLCVLQHWLSGGSNPGRRDMLPSPEDVAPTTEGSTCPVPPDEGFPGDTGGGKVPACRDRRGLLCFTHFGCQDPRRCDRYFIAAEDTQTQTCCGQAPGANCSGCDCGSTYTVVPAGGHPRIARWCHKLADYWCNRVNTRTKCH